MKVTPWWPLGVVNVESHGRLAGVTSGSPQLIETTETPGRLAAVATAGEQVGVVGVVARLDQVDARPGGDGVGPLDVERLLHLPVAVEVARAGRVGARAGWSSGRTRCTW